MFCQSRRLHRRRGQNMRQPNRRGASAVAMAKGEAEPRCRGGLRAGAGRRRQGCRHNLLSGRRGSPVRLSKKWRLAFVSPSCQGRHCFGKEYSQSKNISLVAPAPMIRKTGIVPCRRRNGLCGGGGNPSRAGSDGCCAGHLRQHRFQNGTGQFTRWQVLSGKFWSMLFPPLKDSKG